MSSSTLTYSTINFSVIYSSYISFFIHLLYMPKCKRQFLNLYHYTYISLAFLPVSVLPHERLRYFIFKVFCLFHPSSVTFRLHFSTLRLLTALHCVASLDNNNNNINTIDVIVNNQQASAKQAVSQ